MCAINGFTYEDESAIRAMNAATTHRGPDGTGHWCADGISLGHNRLAIIDLSPKGAQPMVSRKGIVITFNGEIYNYKELRAELTDYPFVSESDTEVIVAAYERWGSQAFEKLNGIFALALWDPRSRELILARDRVGIKPLYYTEHQGKFLFSSEIRGLFTHHIPRRINRDALVHYLRVLYVPAPHTMLEGVYKLLPGHVLTYKDGTYTTRSFVPSAPPVGGATRASLRSTIESAVKRQLVSDRPVGVYLSGGFDSSIMLHAASHVHPAINTYSISFNLGEGHPRHEIFSADAALARESAKHFGATHHELALSVQDAHELFEEMIAHLDEPIGNPTAIPMLALARFTKPTATVVLGGDGGDELFGGYERYRYSLISTYYRALPSFIRTLTNLHPTLRKLDTPPGVERFAQFFFQKDKELTRVLKAPLNLGATRDFFAKEFFTPIESDFESQFMNVDRRSWLVDESLMRTDKMAMASAVEVRVPLLDNEVVEYASRLTRAQKVTPFNTKVLLKEAFKEVLPAYLYHQPKRGWFSPGGEWVKMEPFRSRTDTILSAEYYAPTAEVFNWEEVKAMLARHREGSEYHMPMLWALLTLQAWVKKHNVVW